MLSNITFNPISFGNFLYEGISLPSLILVRYDSEPEGVEVWINGSLGYELREFYQVVKLEILFQQFNLVEVYKFQYIVDETKIESCKST